ncbi:unnamed protein product [Spirodela intermedia]|uniref:RNA helicase n=1 Tax=Spirodela intermedia TaxID=51605 RepID=A0A7I8ILQ2_SPIIN|nr:unnamed protein product [Spirodela intermedia]CAA6658866.1 unnamed protein product [Spirodela intermedia]
MRGRGGPYRSSWAPGGFPARPRVASLPAAVFSVVLERKRHHRDRGGAADLAPADLETLIADCPVRPKTSIVLKSGSVAVKLFFPAWPDALESAVYFWGRRLDGAHEMAVRVLSNVPTNDEVCDRAEEAVRLRNLFAGHARGLLACESVRRCDQRIEEVSAEIRKLSESMKNRTKLPLFLERMARRSRLEEERDQLRQKRGEFQAGLRSILTLLGEEAGGEGSVGKEEGDGVEVFGARGELDWNQIHWLLIRERRRLDEGLPIFAYRRKILNVINSNQVVILVGETGSGKSTQIVQFLADAWLDTPGSIICTQPRKIAAVSLAQRVSEESHGCCQDDLATSYVTYSPAARAFKSKVVFTTDHCFLKHMMNDASLTGVSHVLVDEAHERSLNTDLILALVKSLLLRRLDLRLIVMSATVDARRLSDYYFGCLTFPVAGRAFPVEVKYQEVSCGSADYVADVVKMVGLIHRTEEDGAVLAFLTSQMEVEWACERFEASSSAVVLPLHGKLSREEQHRVFQSFPGKRKVIFSTNIAETSLTIPGVKYVVDSGVVKESRFEPGSGMNVLRVCRISQSSARQRAGRAGRAEAGKCYRLYSESEFQSMAMHEEPEIRKVHLGIAVLRIIALGVKNVQEFDFVDSPDRTGIEPRLGKMILDCHSRGLSKEGVVLAAVMANASSIFCRVGTDEEKLRADCLKVPFCHRDGDLFTLLSVYQEWERAQESKNRWCWQNSINAKSMRRCQETVGELDLCLYNELNIVVPTYWKWGKQKSSSEYCKLLKKVVLSSLAENVAMFSGCDRLGYEVASSGQHLQLHPSCSLFVYGKMPTWVVFGEILSAKRQYLMMKRNEIIGVSRTVLSRLCGRGNSNLRGSRIRIEVDFDRGAIQLHASPEDVDKVNALINDALDHETKYLRNECTEKRLHLELDGRRLTVEICHPAAHSLDDLELLMAVDRHVSGGIATVHRYGGGAPAAASSPEAASDGSRWGRSHFSVRMLKSTFAGGGLPFPPQKYDDCVVVGGIGRDVSEEEIFEVLGGATSRRIAAVRLLRGVAVEQPSAKACEEALLREMSPSWQASSSPGRALRVQVFEPAPMDHLMRALISFDGSLHLEAARALTRLGGMTLPGCQHWQRIQCRQVFRSSLTCPSHVYHAIRTQLDSLLESFNQLRGVEVGLEKNDNGLYRVRISANGTKTIADLRRPLEELMKGKTVAHPELTPAATQLCCSRDGAAAMNSGTIRIFGPPPAVAAAESKLVRSLLALHESRQLEVPLRGGDLPAELMKEVVQKFGPDLRGLEERVPGASFLLHTRRHVLQIRGRVEHRRKVDQIIAELAGDCGGRATRPSPSDDECCCPICLASWRTPTGWKAADPRGLPAELPGGAWQLPVPILLVDLRCLLPPGTCKLEELFRASVAAFVAGSGGAYRFCPSPDCPGVYKVAEEEAAAAPYACGACSAETCRRCHLEYHPWVSCRRYRELKEDPDVSLEEWRRGKNNVKNCPSCGHAIEKTDGCSHVECRCGEHICWECLRTFPSGDDCYAHLRSVHLASL